MAYTQPPKTWASEPLTSSDLNTHVRDQISYLKDPNTGLYRIYNATDLTFTSTSWADLDSTNMNWTITTYGQDLMLAFRADVNHSSGIAFFDFTIDGTRVGTATDGLARITAAAAAAGMVSFWHLVQDLAAGSHTVKVQAKVTAGTLTVYRGQASANNAVEGQTFCREMT